VIVRAVAYHAQSTLVYALIPALSGQDPCALVEALIRETIPVQHIPASLMARDSIQRRIRLKRAVDGITGIYDGVHRDTACLDEIYDALIKRRAFTAALMPSAAPAIHEDQTCPIHQDTYIDNMMWLSYNYTHDQDFR
jgi:hypothetical protein